MRPDEKAIEDIVRKMEDCWNAYDSASMASLFVEDATLIQIYGGQLDGRAAIEGSHRAIFDTIYKGSHGTITLRGIRFLGPDVAIAFTRAHVKYFEAGEPREIVTRPTLILAREQGTWRIVTFQNTRISEMPAEAGAARRLAS